MSINAIDIKFGNWISHNGEPICVTEICDGSVNIQLSEGGGHDWLYDMDECDGIPLTPDILIACGFEKMKSPDEKYPEYQSNADLNFGYPVLWLNKHSKLTQNSSKPTGFLFLNNYRIECKYLHQLQNLYFALTGTELTYNPK